MTMQTKISKIFKIFPAFLAISLITKGSPPKKINRADSLFAANSYVEALSIYEEVVHSAASTYSPLVYLKIASIAEKFNDVPKSLYYLNRYNQLKPSSAIVEKLEVLAVRNGNLGYEKSDFSSAINFVTFYYYYVVLLFVLLGSIIFAVLLLKFYRHERFRKRHSLILVVYFLGLLVIINFPLNVQGVVVKKTVANLREEPSGAAKSVKVMRSGDKLRYFGKIDIWNRVLYNNEIRFINENDCWSVN